MIFPTIPQTYPKSIKSKKSKLFPFVVLLFSDLYTFIGQESPKRMIIAASKISATLYPFLFRYGKRIANRMLDTCGTHAHVLFRYADGQPPERRRPPR